MQSCRALLFMIASQVCDLTPLLNKLGSGANAEGRLFLRFSGAEKSDSTVVLQACAIRSYRKFKMSAFHGGTATPLIAHWPAGIAAKGELRRQPAHVIDLMPTLVELTAATYPQAFRGNPITPMQGRSLAPLFRADSEAPPRDLFWEHMGNKSVRRGQWRAVQSDKQPWRLFDLSRDPTETTDLATQNPARLDELKTAWRDWCQSSNVLR
jgi:arylsulfatase A-like enzyme